MLTEKMVKYSLNFFKKFRHWKEKQWRDIMFSDESNFRHVNSSGAKVRRPSFISRYKQRFTIPMVKHSASVKV